MNRHSPLWGGSEEALRIGSCKGSHAATEFRSLLCVSLPCLYTNPRSFERFTHVKGNGSSEENDNSPVLLFHDVQQRVFCALFDFLQWKQYNTMSVVLSDWHLHTHHHFYLSWFIQLLERKCHSSWTTPIFPVILTLRDCPIRTSCRLLTNSVHE